MSATAKTIHMHAVPLQPTQTAKQKIPDGFYIKARCIQNSAVAFAAPHVREIWDWIIKEANFRDNKTHGVIIKRGQLFTDYNEIIDGLSWREGFVKKGYKKHHVDYAMRWLRQELMITTQKTTRGLIITVCKYDLYQDVSNYEKANDYDMITTGLRQPTDTIPEERKELEEENTEAAPLVLPASPDKELKTAYDDILKNKKDISRFIREQKPAFIEPYMELWNIFALEKGMSRVQDLTDERKRKFKTRIKEKPFDFAAILKKANTSTFLLSSSWFSFDWLIKSQDNYLKVIEGKYDDREAPKQPDNPKPNTSTAPPLKTAADFQNQRQCAFPFLSSARHQTHRHSLHGF